MVLFNKIDFERRFYDFSAEFTTLTTRIQKISKKEDFRQDSIESSVIVKDVSRLFAKELEVIGDFIVENHNSRSILSMIQHFLLRAPIGNLNFLQRTMEKRFNQNISYLNICCLRIIFPSILSKVDMDFLREIKASLYEEESESSQ